MPKVIRTCRICGKKYEACRTIKPKETKFVWQEVACSPECGAEYLRRMTAGIKAKPKENE